MKTKEKIPFMIKPSVPNTLWNWNRDGSLNGIIYREIWDQGQGSVILKLFKMMYWIQQ